ncbi:hypothetical protein [Bdellovibrio sp. HCB2-146]|uniref:hypothetical protein n=1 Tax=Bdellovibrio sp. HCB2-146 TaxID=3394362 RepID=UPI0039BC5446
MMMKNTANLNVKTFIAFLLVFFGWGVAKSANAALPTAKVSIVYFGLGSSEDFEKRVKPAFQQNASACKNCELVNYTPYKDDGSVDMEELVEKIESIPSDTNMAFFDFNLKANEENKKLVELLNKRAMAGMVVVAAAGTPKDKESSSPLSRTVFGQVHDALIIGELGERERLLPTGFYGPEMLTALRPPKEMGQGYSAMIFVANLAENWPKRSSQDWIEYFKNKKMKSRKIWMSLNDLF